MTSALLLKNEETAVALNEHDRWPMLILHQKLLGRIGLEVESVSFIGSADLYGAGRDIDIAVLAHGVLDYGILTSEGWVPTGAGYEDSTFYPYRKGDINLLVFQDSRAYYSRIAAQEACKVLVKAGFLAAHDKDTRVGIFKDIAERIEL